MRSRVRLTLVLAALELISCESSCPAWDAEADGPCNLILGWVWDGHACAVISGCGCVGADCDRLRGDDDGAFCRDTCATRPDAGADAP